MANRKGSKDNKNVNVSTTEDRNEIEALASKLKEQYVYLMSKLHNVTENKNCKKYSYVSKGKSFSKKMQRKTATCKERRKKTSKKKVSSQNATGVKYIKNLSENTLTDAQINLISYQPAKL